MELIGLPMEGVELPAGRYAVLRKIDTRIKQVHLHGFGVPDGEAIPDVESIPCRIEQAGGRVCGRVKLEDGTVVFSAECYLMPEALFADMVKVRGLTIVPTNIDEARAEGFEHLKKDKLSHDLYLATLDLERVVKVRQDIQAEIDRRDKAGVPPEVKVASENLLAGPSTLQ